MEIVDTSAGIHSSGKQLSFAFLDEDPVPDVGGSTFIGFGMLPLPALQMCCSKMFD